MDISPLIPKGRQIITGYGEGGFKINGEWVDGSLLVFPDRVERWKISDAALMPEDFESVLKAEGLELLLLGTGKSMQSVHPAVRNALKMSNISLDVMDTGAACRTYNVLLSEERRVAAALIAI